MKYRRGCRCISKAANVCIAVVLVAAAPARAADWLQFGYDASHSGNNDEEISIANNLASLQLLYRAALPAVADGAPVYLGGVEAADGPRNLLFVTTEDGHIVALDADSGTQIWSQQPATGPATKTTSSPALDPNRQFVYSFGLDGKVHKYTVSDGSETVDDNWPEIATLKPEVEKGSSALAFATAADGHTYLYATTSNIIDDAGDYQGHITSIELSSGAQTVFNALCSNQPIHLGHGDDAADCASEQAGIWSRPAAIYDAANDRIYVTTGNGPYTGNIGGSEWGESVLALSPSLRDSTGESLTQPLDSYTPSQFDALNAGDLDLGVSAPTILPVPANSKLKNVGVQVGKDGILRLLNLDDLSGNNAPGHLDGELTQVTDLDFFGFTSNQAAVWVDPTTGIGWYLLACEDAEYGFMIETGPLGVPRLVPAWSRMVGGTGGGSPVVADGIEFIVEQQTLTGLDPTTGIVKWSMPIAGVHWASPIVVDGKIFLADGDATISAYGAPVNETFAPMPNGSKPTAPTYPAPFFLTNRGGTNITP